VGVGVDGPHFHSPDGAALLRYWPELRKVSMLPRSSCPAMTTHRTKPCG
jgi:hypothetical protein